MKLMIYMVFLVCHVIESFLSEKVDSTCSDQLCEDYKSDSKCRDSSIYCKKNSNSTRFPYPGVCNCCDYCLRNLEEGDYCIIGMPGSFSPLEICGAGLQCIRNERNATCQRIKGPCTEAQDAFDKRKMEGDVGKTEVRPQCDDDGLYKPVHCIPGSICYCIEPTTGNRIFGELPYLDYEDQEKMTCGCAINDWKAKNTLDPTFAIRSARCTEIGTYDALQCTRGSNATCLCVESKTGAPITNTNTVPEKYIRDNHPPCFDASRHIVGRYETECEMDNDNYLSYVGDATLGNEVDACELNSPLCQPDGQFSRLLCSGSKKICVDPDGRQIDVYEAETNSVEGKTMDCNCARTRWLLEKAGVSELPKCCGNGNFEAWQCQRNECYCVDANGNQCGMEVSEQDKSKLKCYNGGDPCESLPTACK